jgi:hypothetical protein
MLMKLTPVCNIGYVYLNLILGMRGFLNVSEAQQRMGEKIFLLVNYYKGKHKYKYLLRQKKQLQLTNWEF